MPGSVSRGLFGGLAELARMSHYRAYATSCNSRSDARQSEIRDRSVLAHVTKRIAAITQVRQFSGMSVVFMRVRG